MLSCVLILVVCRCKYIQFSYLYGISMTRMQQDPARLMHAAKEAKRAKMEEWHALS